MDPHERLRSQIRAARELLGMNQADLAKKLNVSLSKISRVESGETKSGDILLNLKGELEKLGIKFTASGVEIVEDQLEIIEGSGCYLRLLDDVFLTLKDASDKTLLIMFASDKVSPPEINSKYKIMRDAGIKMRQLIEEGDTYIMGNLDEYRTVPSKYFVNVVTLIYANKVAQVSGGEIRVSIHVNSKLSNRERCIFNYFWDAGQKPQTSNALEKF